MNNLLLDKFNEISKGTKIALEIESFFGQDVETKATYIGEIQQDGYTDKHFGSWSCYNIRDTFIPCYKVLVKPYKKRNLYWMRLYMDIKSVKLGW